MTDAEWRDEARMLERDRSRCSLRPTRRAARAPPPRARRRCRTRRLRAMTEATFALYERALAAPRPMPLPPAPLALAPARLRHALGYVPWHPPAPAPRRDAAPGLLTRARARRDAPARTRSPGRVLFGCAHDGARGAAREAE